jgi:hypothetical protein
VHWYRTGALRGNLADPHWAFAWCRELLPYAVRHEKDELSADLSGRVCPICHNASPLCLAERVVARQYNERPKPDERCDCGLEPSWVIVVEYSDHTAKRVPYCGRTPTRDGKSPP